MSPPPPSPIDPETIPRELKDGLTASVLGGLAMVSRMLLSTEKVSFGWVVRRVLAASITACIAGYAVQDYISSPGLRWACVGGIGYCAPEALDYGLAWFKARAGAEVSKVKANGKSKKSKSKRR